MGKTEVVSELQSLHALVVADAGPLIHLDELNALDVLSDYAQVQVPDAVWQEVEHHRPTALCHPAVRWVRVGAVMHSQGNVYTRTSIGTFARYSKPEHAAYPLQFTQRRYSTTTRYME